MSTTEDTPMSPPDDIAREMHELELALLRHGVDERIAERDRCSSCDRTPLIGERVYHYDDGMVACELCRPLASGARFTSHLVHAHTIRIIDQRAA